MKYRLTLKWNVIHLIILNIGNTMDQTRNTSQVPDLLLVFGFIILPGNYEVERDVVVTLVGIMALISVIFNAILLLVILKDPMKQLRTMTAILLAFNSMANLMISLILVLDGLLFWANKNLFPELVIYLSLCGLSLYCVGNLLHTLNIYTSIVFPVRYGYLAPKVRKILVPFLGVIFVIITCVFLIPLYTLPKDKVPSYLKGIITFVCVQLGLLSMTFVCLYTKIFRELYARKQRLETSFHIKRSTPQGMKIIKRNYKVAETLFIHVLFFVIASVPESVIVMLVLYCQTCADPVKLQLATLFSLPCAYAMFIFKPFLWLLRLNSYKQAMKQTLSFSRLSRSKTFNSSNFRMESMGRNERTGTRSSEISDQ